MEWSIGIFQEIKKTKCGIPGDLQSKMSLESGNSLLLVWFLPFLSFLSFPSFPFLPFLRSTSFFFEPSNFGYLLANPKKRNKSNSITFLPFLWSVFSLHLRFHCLQLDLLCTFFFIFYFFFFFKIIYFDLFYLFIFVRCPCSFPLQYFLHPFAFLEILIQLNPTMQGNSFFYFFLFFFIVLFYFNAIDF